MNIMMAVAHHQCRILKRKSIKNREVSAVAKALGRKFSNLAVTLKAAAKKHHLKKIKEATWTLYPTGSEAF